VLLTLQGGLVALRYGHGRVVLERGGVAIMRVLARCAEVDRASGAVIFSG